MFNVPITIENEKKNKMIFLDVQIICEGETLQLLSTVNLPLIGFIDILTAFYHLPMRLFTNLLEDASKYSQVGINYTLN